MANFDFMEINELATAFYIQTIKKRIRTSQELKQAIILSFLKGGINENQKDGLLMAFYLDSETGLKTYSKEDYISILKTLYKEHFINAFELLGLIYYLKAIGQTSKNKLEKTLKELDIKADLLSEEEIKETIEQLSNL